MILDNKNTKEFGKSFEEIPVSKKVWCLCDYCNSEFKKQKRHILSGRKVVNKDCCSSKNCMSLKRLECTKEKHGDNCFKDQFLKKAKKTNQRKYGVDNPAKLDSIKEKTKKTNQERYGADYATQCSSTQEKRKKTCVEKYGIDHAAKSEEVKNKIKQTNQERYSYNSFTQTYEGKEKIKKSCLESFGVSNPMKSKEIQDKLKQTIQEKYGVDHYSQTDEFKDKFKITCLKKFGVEQPLQNEDVLNRFKTTMFKRYGSEVALRIQEFKEKSQSVCLQKYGKKHFMETDEFHKKSRETNLKKYGIEFPSKTQEVKEKMRQTCVDKYGVDHYSKTKEFKDRYRKTCMERYGYPSTILIPNNRIYGKTQREIQKWLNDFGFSFEYNCYGILETKEIDLYNKNLKLAIEYCGLFWHTELSPQPRERNYHYDKYDQCAKKSIQLITIFEDEWLIKQNQCKNYLKSKLKQNKIVYARKTSVQQIDNKQNFNFCEKHHIQGGVNSIVSWGLFFKDKILATISLGKHPRKEEIVLNRLCFSDVGVIGGSQKLWKRCVEWMSENNISEVVTWSDNRWSTGNIYSKLGFVLDGELPPDYSYVEQNRPIYRIPKQRCKKKNIGCPQNITERNWMIQQGFARIWDCGKKRWKFTLNS